MIKACIKSLLIPKYSGFIIYAHNLSHFDGIFLFNELSNFSDPDVETEFNPLLKDNKFINLKFNYSPKNNKRKLKYNITFRDSLLLLPDSLETLAKNFLNKDSQMQSKSLFPYNFMNSECNKNIDLHYDGLIPDMNYFIDTKSMSQQVQKDILNKYSALKAKFVVSNKS